MGKKSFCGRHFFHIIIFSLSFLYVGLFWVGRKLSSSLMETASGDNTRRDLFINDVDQTDNDLLGFIPTDEQDAATMDLWNNSTKMPKWMKKYFRWHRYQRSILNQKNWVKQDYLVMRCMKIDIKCGGVSERLKPIPSMLLVAYQTRRLFMIVWEKPAPLEQFLLPPKGGLDWRAPEWLISKIAFSIYPRTKLKTILQTFTNNITAQPKILNVKYAEEEITGVDYFNDWQLSTTDSGLTFQELFHDVWRVLFTPVPPIATAVQEFLDTAGLTAGDYVGIHVGALQLAQQKAMGRMKQWTQNSIRCASEINPAGPAYLAIDYPMARNIAKDHANSQNFSLILRNVKKASLPLEQPYGQAYRKASEYYDTFIDLYLLGMSRCVVYHAMGYGHLGNLMSWNVSCGIVHQNEEGMRTCSWTLSSDLSSKRTNDKRVMEPLFLDPMEEASPLSDEFTTEVETAAPLTTGEEMDSLLLHTISQRMFAKQPNELPSNDRVMSPYTLPRTGVDVENSPLPLWMKEYFAWHREQRKLLNETNAMNFKFLVMHCLKIDARCGGTADRLKPVPLMILIAYKTKRILMIKWQKPKNLEAFLLPPVGGLDWRLPEYIFPKIAQRFWPAVSIGMIEEAMKNDTEPFMTVRFQSHAAGSEYFDENRPHGPTFADVYHDVWQMVFTPVPPIQKIIEDKMEELGLVPGQYAAAHVRALYGIEERELFYVRDWTFNSLNCASMLFPGGPTFFASDSSIAVALAEYYGEMKKSKIAVRKHDNPPLHLDKTSKWRGRKAPDYYDTFVDLYLLGMSRCVTYNIGGYGSWGLLLSSNSSCGWKHHDRTGSIRCNWTELPPNEARVIAALKRPIFAKPIGD